MSVHGSLCLPPSHLMTGTNFMYLDDNRDGGHGYLMVLMCGDNYHHLSLSLPPIPLPGKRFFPPFKQDVI